MMDKIKPGDIIYIPIYYEDEPDESLVGEEEVFDVGKKGIYLNCNEGCADFWSYDEIGKLIFLTEEEAEKELLCMIARS